MRFSLILALAALASSVSLCPVAAQAQSASTPGSAEFRSDALELEALVNRVYAYPERLPGGRFSLTPKLRLEAEAVTDRRSLLRFAERALLLLADHHAITGASFNHSWALVPSYSDLWIEQASDGYFITAVRLASPADLAGISAGDELVQIGGVPIAEAVRAFWTDLGAEGGIERIGFAARMLAAGRRDRPRLLSVRNRGGKVEVRELANLYVAGQPSRPPVESRRCNNALHIRINDALGDMATIGAFDLAMRSAGPGDQVVIDLRETPGGGNTIVARGILGWFVDRPRSYQMHNLPAEQRRTGIARQWVEQVLPREGMFHPGPVEVQVGRWTGSMGEGLAIGFDAIGARVVGSRMAGLLGAIEDHRLTYSAIVLKLPTERLMTVDGLNREDFVPSPSQAPQGSVGC